MEGKTLLQKFGFKDFSFQDIASMLHLRKQSIQSHFKTKEDLGRDLITEYREQLKAWSQTVAYFKPEDQIGAWFECNYEAACDGLRYCSLGAFATDFNSLSKNVKKQVNQAYGELKNWLSSVIEKGQKDKNFRRDYSAEELAEIILSLCFGAQQLTRLACDPEQIKRRQKDALRFLKG